jgi:hypothetical protein
MKSNKWFRKKFSPFGKIFFNSYEINRHFITLTKRQSRSGIKINSSMIRYIIILLSIVLINNTKCRDSNTSAPPETTVYITTSGTKYHLENCRSLKKSKVAIPLSDAVRKGYDPCKICHPPTIDSLTK